MIVGRGRVFRDPILQTEQLLSISVGVLCPPVDKVDIVEEINDGKKSISEIPER